MVEVFKTNVSQQSEAAGLLAVLTHQLPGCTINFDLQDCDRILRIEGSEVSAAQIIELLDSNGFLCALLD